MNETTKKTCEQWAQYEGTAWAPFSEMLTAPPAPIVVLLTEQMESAPEQLFSELERCPALTVIAGADLSRIPATVLAAFDVRLATCLYPAEQMTLDFETDAAKCGKRAAARRARGEKTTEGFLTQLEETSPFSECVTQYLTTLTKDKSREQLMALAACFRAARKGDQEAIFAQESLQFYRLMQRKAEEEHHETEA